MAEFLFPPLLLCFSLGFAYPTFVESVPLRFYPVFGFLRVVG
jgi:hypothetical protein